MDSDFVEENDQALADTERRGTSVNRRKRKRDKKANRPAYTNAQCSQRFSRTFNFRLQTERTGESLRAFQEDDIYLNFILNLKQSNAGKPV